MRALRVGACGGGLGTALAPGAEHLSGELRNWIAMELVQGITLKRWLQTHGPMPLAQFVPFFECIAQVVQAAHDREIVHRNLKPLNVMVIEGVGRLFPSCSTSGWIDSPAAMPGRVPRYTWHPSSGATL